MKRDLISINDLSREEIEGFFDIADCLKRDNARFGNILSGKSLALIFQKPSNRTRVSFEVGMYQLGGHVVYLGPGEINLGVRESIKDVAKTLSRYVNGIVLRTFAHKNVIELAGYADVPVINGLSDFSHPCQGLADIYTVKEKLGKTQGITFAYVGDGNNVCNSLLFACSKSGIHINVATPKGHEPDKGVLAAARRAAKLARCKVNLFNDPFSAVKGADVIYTDVWASMGQEKEAIKRRKIFKKFQLNKKLASLANKNVLIMHCLPAHRGEEITDDVIDGPNSVVFDQAENRLHVQKAILIKLLKGDK